LLYVALMGGWGEDGLRPWHADALLPE
jgi:hypothetical protein